MNWHKGLNLVFGAATVAWTVYILLLYPMQKTDGMIDWRDWILDYHVLIFFVILPPVVSYLLLWLSWFAIVQIVRMLRRKQTHT